MLPDYSLHTVNDRAGLEQVASLEIPIRPALILCDEQLIQAGRDPLLEKMRRMANNAPIMVMVANTPETLDIQWLQSGVRGCCPMQIEAEMLNKAVATLLAGETWLPRRLVARVIDNLFEAKDAIEHPPQKQDNRLATLTPREREVAQLVTAGLNNKLIARQLHVTERTVKAHLSNIFQKLNIENRLMLALALKPYFE